ncbi:M50 family metallopeptidase [Actinomycetospora callitridis]|uniref:M50 family metallopeptidase n=1 Tax=Actinomycetospora callitridis TaxID=913944 RepID=UPI0023660449|nr:M50 family metallopeptidase [Actinomycetospora callitridis]MDD7920797.1 M50 family metallopeptidase [Actinomycetospora callitridis]
MTTGLSLPFELPSSSTLDGTLDELTGGQTQATLVILAGLVALLVVGVHGSWRLARNVVTIAHEGGHALVAICSGRTLTRILLHSDTSGVTVSKGRRDGPGMVATAAAGYATPPVLGVGAAALVAADAISAMLVIAVVLLLATLILIRNAYGVLSVALTGAVFVVVAVYGSANVQYGFACFVTWFLILGGLRTVLEVQRKRTRRRAPDSDADQLERLTGVPGGIWVALFALAGIFALIGAGRLLVVWPPV